MGTVAKRVWLLGQLLILVSAFLMALRGEMRVADILLAIAAVGQLVWLRWLHRSSANPKPARDADADLTGPRSSGS